jgi:hypothetical protein
VAPGRQRPYGALRRHNPTHDQTPRGHGPGSSRPAGCAGRLWCLGQGRVADTLAHRVTQCVGVRVLHLESVAVSIGLRILHTERIANRIPVTFGIAVADIPTPRTDRGHRGGQ